jgi:hypothetical protein
VAPYPAAPDPVGGDFEGEYRHRDAVLLHDQAGLAVDRALQERHVGVPELGDLDPGPRDLLTNCSNFPGRNYSNEPLL